jgi:hypothetical protein
MAGDLANLAIPLGLYAAKEGIQAMRQRRPPHSSSAAAAAPHAAGSPRRRRAGSKRASSPQRGGFLDVSGTAAAMLGGGQVKAMFRDLTSSLTRFLTQGRHAASPTAQIPPPPPPPGDRHSLLSPGRPASKAAIKKRAASRRPAVRKRSRSPGRVGAGSRGLCPRSEGRQHRTSS